MIPYGKIMRLSPRLREVTFPSRALHAVCRRDQAQAPCSAQGLIQKFSVIQHYSSKREIQENILPIVDVDGDIRAS